MATLKMPISTTLLGYRMTVALDGLYYDFAFRFNRRDNHWYMDVVFNGVNVIMGVKIVHSDDLLLQYPEFRVDDRLPPGTMQVIDATGADRDPDKSTFGDDVTMFYVEAA